MATVNEKMKAIADAIRAKTGKTDPLTLDGMAAEIAAISGGGGSSGGDGTTATSTCELEVYYDGAANDFYFREEVVCTMGSDGKTHYNKNKVADYSTLHVNHPEVECGSVYILGVDEATTAGYECSGVEQVTDICWRLAMIFRVTAGPGEKATIRMYKNA